MLGTFLDFLLVVLGFSSIVVIHEFGHFLAARWAGVRVLAFAVGFGPALLSFRQGLGLRVGSSAPEFAKMELEGRAGGVSSTEYRLNGLPFGGYVKMLGQEDFDPTATSAASDSYQTCPPWKKLIIISAGVVFNVIAAAVLFIIVFMAGLRTESPRIGIVSFDTPAAGTMPINAAANGVTDPGLQPGDLVTQVNGHSAHSFNDVLLAGAMAKPGKPVNLTVQRDGIAEPLQFSIIPEAGRLTGLLELGVGPSFSPVVVDLRTESQRTAAHAAFASIGLDGLRSGMRLVRAGTITEIKGASAIDAAARASGGLPFEVEFVGEDGAKLVRTVTPVPELEEDAVRNQGKGRLAVDHLLGLVPVMIVGDADEDSAAFKKGLRTGDVFVRLGSIEFPSIVQGMAEIKSAAGRDIAVTVLRKNDAGEWNEVNLPGVAVSRKGLIGFSVGDSARTHALLAASPQMFVDPFGKESVNQAASLGLAPGSVIEAVNEIPVSDFVTLRAALKESAQSGAAIALRVRPPSGVVRTIDWNLSPQEVERLGKLSWNAPFGNAIFEPEFVTLKAKGPGEAVSMGLDETRRVMLMTYATFSRLFEGTIKLEHLKGPVGIAHVGTLLASRGFVWLLFFLALISVNLAVINFLPMPIVDGGQFLLIVYEQIRGRPASIAFQNVITIAGLLLIGSMFLIVTYNDIRNLLGI